MFTYNILVITGLPLTALGRKHTRSERETFVQSSKVTPFVFTKH